MMCLYSYLLLTPRPHRLRGTGDSGNKNGMKVTRINIGNLSQTTHHQNHKQCTLNLVTERLTCMEASLLTFLFGHEVVSISLASSVDKCDALVQLTVEVPPWKICHAHTWFDSLLANIYFTTKWRLTRKLKMYSKCTGNGHEPSLYKQLALQDVWLSNFLPLQTLEVKIQMMKKNESKHVTVQMLIKVIVQMAAIYNIWMPCQF